MLYIGYRDPLTSHLNGMLQGLNIELDNKALKAFTFADSSSEEPKDLGFSQIFPKFDQFLASTGKTILPNDLLT